MSDIHLDSEDVRQIENETSVSGHKKKKSGISNIFSNLFSRFNHDDLLLIGILFLLIEEGIEDDLLILILVFLILTGSD